MMPKEKAVVGGVSQEKATADILANAKAQRIKVKAIISGSGNLNNAEATAAIRELAQYVQKLERVLSLLTNPSPDDFS